MVAGDKIILQRSVNLLCFVFPVTLRSTKYTQPTWATLNRNVLKHMETLGSPDNQA